MNGHTGSGRPEMAPPPLAVAPSRAAHTLGILSMIFGGIGALGGLWQILGGLIGRGLASFWQRLPGPSGGQDEEMLRRLREIHEIHASIAWAHGAQGLLMLVLSIALISIGLGQLRFRRWAVRATRIWGVVSLLALAAILVLQATVVAPTLREAMARMAEGLPEGRREGGRVFEAMGTFAVVASILGTAIVYAPYPIVLLVAFTRPRVVASMTA